VPDGEGAVPNMGAAEVQANFPHFQCETRAHDFLFWKWFLAASSGNVPADDHGDNETFSLHDAILAAGFSNVPGALANASIEELLDSAWCFNGTQWATARQAIASVSGPDVSSDLCADGGYVLCHGTFLPICLPFP